MILTFLVILYGSLINRKRFFNLYFLFFLILSAFSNSHSHSLSLVSSRICKWHHLRWHSLLFPDCFLIFINLYYSDFSFTPAFSTLHLFSLLCSSLPNRFFSIFYVECFISLKRIFNMTVDNLITFFSFYLASSYPE